ncbi:unnamed protein product [Nippostrongylus brasiliensis]|uniref:Cystatin domain-containing protein n=1 Tax=Nippostrongylus brasiliensis TaxID=27835 RepID=A0A0N4XQM9_NIPBR|nr:unnamed protein product [Nippostrongylus brasiliensis]
MPALTAYVVDAPTSDYVDEEVEALNMELQKLYKEDHTFYKVAVGGLNAKIGSARPSKERSRPLQQIDDQRDDR